MQLTLKAARVNAGMSQIEASAKIGTSKTTLGKWERGETFPTLDVYDRICTIYNVPFGSIILPRT